MSLGITVTEPRGLEEKSKITEPSGFKEKSCCSSPLYISHQFIIQCWRFTLDLARGQPHTTTPYTAMLWCNKPVYTCIYTSRSLALLHTLLSFHPPPLSSQSLSHKVPPATRADLLIWQKQTRSMVPELSGSNFFWRVLRIWGCNLLPVALATAAVISTIAISDLFKKSNFWKVLEYTRTWRG